jgi:Ca2+-binding EF-hand superfamily protein
VLHKSSRNIPLPGNGTVEFNEFVEMMGKKMVFVDPEEELLDAFKKFDRNGDGKITPEELKHYLTAFGDEKFTVEEAEDFIKEFDCNGDGVIDYQGRFFCHLG